MTPAADAVITTPASTTAPATTAPSTTAPATTAPATTAPATTTHTTPSRPKRRATTKSKDKEESESDSEEEVKPPPKKAKVDDEDEKRVKVVRKGRAAVDTNFGKSKAYHVLEEGDEIWDCMLNQTNIGNNNNKFYVIQLLEIDGGGTYSVWNRWGRVGENGQNMLKTHGSNLKSAKQDFMKKFKDKTANNWNDRSSFKPKPNKYTLIEIDYGSDEPEKEKDTSEDSPKKDKKDATVSTLNHRVQDVVKLIFDIKLMEHVMVEMEFDIKKSPLGKLTKKQIKEGYEVLKQIEEVLKIGSKSNLSTLSSDFYTKIPHSFGRSIPPLISDLESLKKKMQMLEALGDIEIATKIIKETEASGANPIDSNYQKLKCTIDPLEHGSVLYKHISDFVATSQEEGRGQQLELIDVFEVSREGEATRFDPHKLKSNRRLLWHGSRLTNFAGILSQGLRIAPPEAPASGYRFGKGLYFADIMTLSSVYCRVTRDNPIGFMLLVDTALGEMYECPKDKYMDKPPPGFDSTWALGIVEPDPKDHVIVEGNLTIPIGKIIKNSRRDVNCHEHQFITYSEAQSQLRYLLKLKWIFK